MRINIREYLKKPSINRTFTINLIKSFAPIHIELFPIQITTEKISIFNIK